MRGLTRLAYRSFVGVIGVYRRLFLDLHVWGRERIPPGPKIYVTNHISTTDPYWVLPVFREPVHIIIGPGYQSKVMGWVYDRFEQINALPAFRKNVVDEAVGYLGRGESVYTAPEGDLHEPLALGPFFPGVGRIYRRSRVPIIPIALLAPRRAMREFPRLNMMVEGRVYRAVMVTRGPYCINVGEPWTPEVQTAVDEGEDARRITEELRDRVWRLLQEIRDQKLPTIDWTASLNEGLSRE